MLIKPRYILNFPSHLANCEFNYRRLRRLMPGWRAGQTKKPVPSWHYLIGTSSQNETALALEVKESAKYTTVLRISVCYELVSGRTPKDNRHQILEVRLSHDATVAEVIACDDHRQIQAKHDYPNAKMYQRDEKVQLNCFLGELLEHCLAHGRVKQDIIPSQLFKD